jgi:lactoylglutathione lyase
MYTDFQINLYVEDVERAVGFYAAIGAIESFRTPMEGTPDHVEVRLAGATIGLASVRAARERHGLDVSAEGNAAEIVLWTDDLDPTYDALVAAGGRVMAAPETLPTGLRVAWVADLDGNPVHLVQRIG